MTQEVKGRSAENQTVSTDRPVQREVFDRTLQPQGFGVRQIFKLLILFYVSYRLFCLAPYNQLPNFDIAADDVKLSPTTTDKPISSAHVNKKVKKEEPSTKPVPTSTTSKPKRVDRNYVNQLMKEADSLQKSGSSDSKSKIVSLYQEILESDPRHTYANLQLGFMWIVEMENPDLQGKGFALLEKTLDGKYVDNPFLYDTPQAFVLSQTIGRYRLVRHTPYFNAHMHLFWNSCIYRTYHDLIS